MIKKISKKTIKKIIDKTNSSTKSKDRDEMAIPTYLHKNFLIKWLFWKRHEKIIKLANFNKKRRVFSMDFGCGLGILLPTLSKYSKKVYATDLFPEYAKTLCKIKKCDNVIFFVSEKLDQNIKNNQIDLVIAADVMEHLDDPGKHAMLFYKKLNKKGKLIISGPTENFLYKIGRLVAGFNNKADYHHNNIDDLDKIVTQKKYKKIKSITLPFKFLPLFKIIKYSK